jgi:uncharacterized protein YutE (UPF0331/DUF86 family)
MLDRERVLAYLAELVAALEDWERYRSRISQEQLLRDRDVRNMVLHAMLIAIQAAIDIGQHILVAHRWERPGSYRETFDLLVAHGVIGDDLGEQLARLAGFRNALVHVYWKLDFEAVFRVFHGGPEPLQAFCGAVKRLLTGEAR